MSSSRPTWLAGLFVATLALGTDEFVVAGVLPRIAADLDVSTGAAGQLVTAFALAFALGAPVLGVVLDPLPRRPVLIGGLSLFVVANLAAAVAPDHATLLVLRVVAGLAAATVSAGAFAAAAQGAPEGRTGSFLSVVTAGLTVALFTGVPLGTWVGESTGWRSTFVLVAAVGAAATAVLALRLPALPGTPSTALRDRVRPLSDPRVLRLVVAVLLCGSGGLMFYTYLAPVVERSAGSTGPLPMVLLVVGVIGVPSALLGGRLADAFGGRRARLGVIGGHAVALGLVAVLLGLCAPFWALLVATGAWSVFAWALNPPLQASTVELAPDAPMAAIALNISGLYLGTALGGALGGVLVDGPGVVWVPVVAAGLLVLAWLSASFRTPVSHVPVG